MKEKDKYKVIAEACRMESDGGELYLVFKIIDEKFKAKIKKDWMRDIDLKIDGKNLYEFE